MEASAAEAARDAVHDLFDSWKTEAYDSLLQEDFCKAICELAEISESESIMLFKHVAGDQETIDREQLRQWLLSQDLSEQILQSSYCPDSHCLTKFVPEVDGWCCEECGEDLDVNREVFQCKTCDGLCWCLNCGLTIGLAAAEVTAIAAAGAFLEKVNHEAGMALAQSEYGGDEIQVEKTAEEIEDVEEEAAEAEEKHEMNTGPLKVYVNSITGACAEIDARGSWTTGQLKGAIEEKTGIPEEAQTLLWGVVVLQDEDVLATHGMGIEADVNLLRRSELQVSWLTKARSERMRRPYVTELSILASAPEEIRCDRLVVLEAVSRFGDDLQYASTELQGDEKIAMAAWKQSLSAFRYISQELLADRRFAIAAVADEGMRLQCLPSELRSDRDVVVTSLNNNGMALRYVSLESELLHDAEILDTAFQNSFRLDRNRNMWGVSSVVLVAIARDPAMCKFIAPELRADRCFAHKLIAINGSYINHVAWGLHAEESIISAAITNGFKLRHANKELRNCREVVCATVSKDGRELQFASPGLRANRQVVLSAVRQCGMALQFAGHLLRNERKIVEAAVKQDSQALKFAGAYLKHDSNLLLG